MSLQYTPYTPGIAGPFTMSSRRDTDPLSDAVKDALQHYFDLLEGTPPNNLYQMVMQQVERPLFEMVLNKTGGNQSRAATLLGISRSTLRKKLALYEIE